MGGWRKNEVVPNALMIPFQVIMGGILLEYMAKRPLAEKNHSIQTFGFDRQDEMILFGERALRHVLKEYAAHYHFERNHQGIGNNLIFPQPSAVTSNDQTIECRERLGGLLKSYHRRVA